MKRFSAKCGGCWLMAAMTLWPRFSAPTFAQKFIVEERPSFDFQELGGESFPANVLDLTDVAVDPSRNRLYAVGRRSDMVVQYDRSSGQFTRAFPSGFVGDVDRRLVAAPSFGLEGMLYAIDLATSTINRIDVKLGTVAKSATISGGIDYATVDKSSRERLLIVRAASPSLLYYDAFDLVQEGMSSAFDGEVGPPIYDASLDRYFIPDLLQVGAMAPLGPMGEDVPVGEILRFNPVANNVDLRIEFQIFGAGVDRIREAEWVPSSPLGRGFIVRLDGNYLMISDDGTPQRIVPIPADFQPIETYFDAAKSSIATIGRSAPVGAELRGVGGRLLTFRAFSGATSVMDDIPFGRQPTRPSVAAGDAHFYALEPSVGTIWDFATTAYAAPTAIHLGEGPDQAAFLPTNRLLIGTNRLGGNTLFSLGPDDASYLPFGVGYWPYPVRSGTFDGTEHAIVVNAWDSTLTVIATGDVIDLGLPRGTTERLPDLALDLSRGLAFVAYPEFAKIVVVDWPNQTIVRTLDVAGFAAGDTGGGPGELQLAVNETFNRLFAFDRLTRTLHVYDGFSDFDPVSPVNLSALDWSRMDNAGLTDWFFRDASLDRLLIGPFLLDPIAGTSLGSNLLNAQRVFAIDPIRNIYLADQVRLESGKRVHRLRVYERGTRSQLYEQIIGHVALSVPQMSFDQAAQRIYATSPQDGAVRFLQIVDLNTTRWTLR